MHRTLRLSGLIVSSALLVPAAASAQATPGLELAGGALLRGDTIYAGGADVGLKVGPAGDSVLVRVASPIACGGGSAYEGVGEGTGTIGPGGTFTATLRDTNQDQPGVGDGWSRVRVRGAITEGAATGELQIRLRKARGGRPCSGTVPFRARAVPDLSAAPVAPPTAGVLLGRVHGVLAPIGAPLAFNLRVSGDGRRVQRLGFGHPLGCAGQQPAEETWWMPPATVRPDGTFRARESGRSQWSSTRDATYTATADGRFVAGGATGTARVRLTLYRRGTKRVTARCDSGVLTWSALR